MSLQLRDQVKRIGSIKKTTLEIDSDKDKRVDRAKVKERIDRLHEHLKKIEGRTDFESDEYCSVMKDFYTALRAT